MHQRRTWLAILLLIAVAMAAGCDGGRRYRDQMAVIEVGSDGSLGFEAGLQVTLPDTIAAGRAMHVRIRTYGGGCLIRDPQRGGKTFVNVKGREAVIIPWDRLDLGPRSPTVNWNCAGVLTYWTRVVPVVFHSGARRRSPSAESARTPIRRGSSKSFFGSKSYERDAAQKRNSGQRLDEAAAASSMEPMTRSRSPSIAPPGIQRATTTRSFTGSQ